MNKKRYKVYRSELRCKGIVAKCPLVSRNADKNLYQQASCSWEKIQTNYVSYKEFGSLPPVCVLLIMSLDSCWVVLIQLVKQTGVKIAEAEAISSVLMLSPKLSVHSVHHATVP